MKKIVSMFLALAMCLSMTPAVFAADTTVNSDLIPIADEGISREEAIEALGLTEEEAEEAQFYVLPTESMTPSTTYGTAMDLGVYDLGEFTFSDYNLGAYRTYNGNRVKFSVIYKNNAECACTLIVHFMQYGGEEFGNVWCYYDGVWKSDTIDINYGVDYLFEYSVAVTGGGIEDPRWPPNTTQTSATVRILVAILS